MLAADFIATLTSIPVPVIAIAVGIVCGLVTVPACRRALLLCEVTPGQTPRHWGVIAALLTAGLTVALLSWKLQETPDVRPSVFWWYFRPVYHSLLIVLLIVATATDLRSYYILDVVTGTGVVIAIALATISGDLQMCHLWVDWNQEVPQLRGPYIPAWLGESPHWHGLAWSLAGLIAGAGITWIARLLSRLVLGQEALGFGDVTLMGMIGAFLGWQAVILVFLLAPLCALMTGMVVRLLTSRTYVPYGPYLSLAAVLVLFNWGRLWMFEWQLSEQPQTPAQGAAGAVRFSLRRLFGDPVGLLILAGMIVGGLTLLLGAWRIYLALPGRHNEASPPDAAGSHSTPTP